MDLLNKIVAIWVYDVYDVLLFFQLASEIIKHTLLPTNLKYFLLPPFHEVIATLWFIFNRFFNSQNYTDQSL